MSELSERLLRVAKTYKPNSNEYTSSSEALALVHPQMLREAAARIDELEAHVAEVHAALRGVIAVADRKTDEFDRARAAIRGKQ